MNTKALLFGAMAVLVLALLPLDSRAQDYPTRPIRLVTMFSTGSLSDTNARYVGAKLGEQLGVTLVVDNKPGGGGIIALRDVYRSQPLGYSILLSNTAFVSNTYYYKEPVYKIEDYTPVGVVGQSHYALIMHNSIPASNLAEFVGWAKANPSKINYGGVGPAAGNTLNAERFKQAAGINMVGIPFKGGEGVAIALLAGQVHVYWATLTTARTHMRNAQIVGLAITADERSNILPQLPTFTELGYPTMNAASWQALFAPSATPAPMINRLRDAFVKVADGSEWKARMERNEFEAFRGSPDQFMAKIRQEAAQLADDYKRLKLPQE